MGRDSLEGGTSLERFVTRFVLTAKSRTERLCRIPNPADDFTRHLPAHTHAPLLDDAFSLTIVLFHAALVRSC